MCKYIIATIIVLCACGYLYASGMGTGMDMGMDTGGGSGGAFQSKYLVSGTDPYTVSGGDYYTLP